MRPRLRDCRHIDRPAIFQPGVDLAIVTVPVSAVLSVIDDCAAAAVRAVVVITAGFAEAGADGRDLQQRLTERVRNHGMRMVGPNCMGVMNASPDVSLNASFSPITAPAGRVGLMSQSGAVGVAILALAAERRIGLSTFVSAGNKADVSGNDLLEYWADDPKTNTILLYLESFGNPRRFARLARTIGRHKPIVAVKSGRTRAGTRAASSHTAALAASDTAVEALFHQAGVIRADTIDEMFDIAALLNCQPLPAGRRVAIVTNAGGPGILAADASEAAGLTMATFSDATRERLAAALPSMASCGNPVDMVASAGADAYRQTIEVVMAAPETDAVAHHLHGRRRFQHRRGHGGDPRRRVRRQNSRARKTGAGLRHGETGIAGARRTDRRVPADLSISGERNSRAGKSGHLRGVAPPAGCPLLGV